MKTIGCSPHIDVKVLFLKTSATQLIEQKSGASTYIEPSLLLTSVHVARDNLYYLPKEKVKSNPSVDPIMYNGVLSVRYPGVMVAQFLHFMLYNIK